MTEHTSIFEAEQAIPDDEAMNGWLESRADAQHFPRTVGLRAPAPNQDEQQEAAAMADTGRPEAPPGKRRRLRPLLLVGFGLAALAGAAEFGWNYWTVGRFEISTDDAYVQADNTTIAPKVSGYIASVLVSDNSPVTAGQVLARIDERDFNVALDQARANVAAAEAAISSKKAELDAQQSIINAARATVEVDQANLTFASQDNQRYTTLAKSGFGSVQNAQQAAARIAAAQATLERDNASLLNATKQIDVLNAAIAQEQAVLASRRADQKQAELNLSYTSIVSPIDGVVGNRTLRVGQYVQAGTQLMAVVPISATYIVANYKETQLTDVQSGQAVDIEVDMFPGIVAHGRVDSLAPASGQQFALLPPDNATGNFTKIVQRIPVKITLDPSSPLTNDLRPGMSVYPTIKTKPVASGESVVAQHAN